MDGNLEGLSSQDLLQFLQEEAVHLNTTRAKISNELHRLQVEEEMLLRAIEKLGVYHAPRGQVGETGTDQQVADMLRKVLNEYVNGGRTANENGGNALVCVDGGAAEEIPYQGGDISVDGMDYYLTGADRELAIESSGNELIQMNNEAINYFHGGGGSDGEVQVQSEKVIVCYANGVSDAHPIHLMEEERHCQSGGDEEIDRVVANGGYYIEYATAEELPNQDRRYSATQEICHPKELPLAVGESSKTAISLIQASGNFSLCKKEGEASEPRQ